MRRARGPGSGRRGGPESGGHPVVRAQPHSSASSTTDPQKNIGSQVLAKVADAGFGEMLADVGALGRAGLADEVVGQGRAGLQ